MSANSKRNYCLDFFKGIACICVVFMHCEFPGILGTIVQCVSRFCVPYFFMVSGYFAYYKDNRPFPAKKKILHILEITIIASVFYALVAVVRYFITGESLQVSARSILYFLMFNQPFIIAGQLWFLFALIYVYILYSIVDKLKLHKYAYYSIPVLIIMYIILAQGAHLLGYFVPNYIYRNFLIEGFPLFMLGHLIHKNEEKLLDKFNNKLLITIISVSTLLCLAERYIMGRDFGVNILTFPQVTAIFVFTVRNWKWGGTNILTTLGKKYSLYVYAVHPFVWHSLEYIYNVLKVNNNIFALYIMPLLVLLVTIVLSIIVVKIVELIKKTKLVGV